MKRSHWLLPGALALSVFATAETAQTTPAIRHIGATPTDAHLADAPLPEGAWHVRVGPYFFSPALDAALPPDQESYRLVSGRTPPPWTEPYRLLPADGWTLLAFPDGVPSPWPDRGTLLPPGYGDGTGPLRTNPALCRAGGTGEGVAISGGLEIAAPFQAPRSARSVTAIDESQVNALVSQVSSRRYSDTIRDLTDFGQRNSYTDGVDDARDYISARFASHGLTTTTPLFNVGGSLGSTSGYNVVGIQTGTLHPEEFIVVGAHYDSLPNPPQDSPGAEDNASGTAAVLEMARILSTYPHQRTIVYITFSGEEQGLDGSAAYVASLDATERSNLVAALTMDMISYTADAQLDVLLETFSWAAWLRDELALAAEDYTDLVVFTSFNPFGSDHMPFLNNSIPAMLSIQNDWDVYPQYHQAGDTIDRLTFSQGVEILKMNIAAAARLANPTPPTPTNSWMILAD